MIDPITEYILDEDEILWNKLQANADALSTTTGIMLALIALRAAIQIKRVMNDKKYRSCLQYKDDYEKEIICRKKYDAEILKKQIVLLKKALNGCNKVKNGKDKCKKKIMDEIRKKEIKLKKIQDKLKKWGS
jgi:hypothetical protein